MPRADRLEIPDLPAELTRLLEQIPPGRITTYGEIARSLGDVRAAAWVGEWMLHHPHDAECPCHRVIRSTGEVGLYITRSTAEKEQRLRDEGTPVAAGRVERTDHLLTATELTSASPLAQLYRFQEQLAPRVRETPLAAPPELFCGLDVAYPRPGIAQGAAVVTAAGSCDVLWEHCEQGPAAFPYIPGYLAFRELPMLLSLWARVIEAGWGKAVCLVDGNGRLHPRRAGVASCFGVLADAPTIGVSKSLLCGRPDDSAPRIAGETAVVDSGEAVAAVLPGRGGGRPIYISVGAGITLQEAVTLARGLRTGHRLPEPVHLADRLSKRPK